MATPLNRKRIALFPSRATVPPLTINFAALADGALPAQFYAPTFRIQSGALINTPTFGAEYMTDGDMELAGVTNYPAYGTPTTREKSGTQKHGGAQSLRIVSDAAYEGFTQNVSPPTDAWCFYSGWMYVVAGSARIILQDWRGWSHSAQGYPFVTGVWSYRTCCTRKIAGSSQAEGIDISAGTEIFYDDLSLREINFPTALATLDARIANVNLVAPPITGVLENQHANPVGIVLCVDNPTNPWNLLLAFLDGVGNCKIVKRVNGVYTALASGAVAWASNKFFSAKHNNGTFDIYYGTTNFGTLVATVTATDASLIRNTNHGLLSMWSGFSMGGTLSIAPYS